MSDESGSATPTDATSTGESDQRPPPMGVEDLLDVLRAAVARLPRDVGPVVREERS